MAAAAQKNATVTNPLRSLVYELCMAFRRGDVDWIFHRLHEDVVFTSYAPIPAFPTSGRKRGRAAVCESIRAMHAGFEILSYAPLMTLVEESDAAVLVTTRLKQRESGRIIQLLLAHFLKFEAEKILEFREFMDSFDAVEQVLGRELNFH